ncbi:WYL domain-containing protein [Marinobacter sp.]|uniref:helix-turn-helix transcriptional regulator n=1 Tax=Marinobacter sp. TaxID=50741 RepID=UPI0023575143|nr:WYL domain-containing protein [Marinobacter sp.]
MSKHRDIQLERLFYIEFLALFVGQVSRKDLVSRFGISEPAATKDLALYSDFAPGMIDYDLRKKCYVYCGDYSGAHFQHDVYQSLFSLLGERAISADYDHAQRLDGWISSSIKRKLPPPLVATITRCISQSKKLTGKYRSLSSGDTYRLLSPLAIVHDGLRWHVRCFDHTKGDFRDFNLTRFSGVREGEGTDVSLLEDRQWNTEVELRLTPHPRALHPETIRLDYDIQGRTKDIKLKACFVGYFLRQWNIDFSDDASGNPKAQHLFLENKAELKELGVPEWALET